MSAPALASALTPTDVRNLIDGAALVAAAVLAYVAMQRKGRTLGMAAGLFGASVLAGVMLLGFIVFPIEYWIWRRNPGKGYGWLLIATLVLSTLVLVWRIPWPGAVPSGPLQSATATVRHVRTVRHVWSSWRQSGQALPVLMEVAELVFTPPGARAPVVVTDSVDLGSVPGLREGGAVAVAYPAAHPAAGRIAGARRTYARRLLVSIAELTGMFGALVSVLGWMLGVIDRRLRRWRSVLVPTASGESRLPGAGGLPADDPRRQALERYLREQR